MTSDVAGATKDDDDDVVVVAEKDCGTMPATDVNVANNITGVVTDAQDVYDVWNKEVPDDDVGDVDRINNDVKVTKESASGGVTRTKWDQPLKVIPEVTAATKVPPTGTG